MSPRITSVDDLVALIGIAFSDEQIAAITAEMAPGVIIAGAGSGKTTVMAARVVWLVGSGQIDPDQVLGLTFTRKAAGELSARVRAALGRLDADDDRQPDVFTYDAFAARLVQEFGGWLGWGSNIRILSDAERYLLADQVVRCLAEPLEALADKALPTLSRNLLRLESRIQAHLATDESIIADSKAFLADLNRVPLYHGAPYRIVSNARRTVQERLELLRLCQHYRRLKTEQMVAEFGDQMAMAIAAARQLPQVGQAMRRRYGLVVVDEFQDTSAAQAHLLSQLFGSDGGIADYPVTAVGDPLQAIYTWRGAAVDNIYSFGQFFPSAHPRTFTLSINRRSGPEILAAANAVAARVRDESGPGAVALRADAANPAADLEVREFGDWADEVEWVAGSLLEAHQSGRLARWDQAAVLVRRNRDIGPLFEACRRRGIPVAVNDLGGLLSIEAISQVYAMMRLLTDPDANPEVAEILSGPRFRLGAVDLGRLGRRARELAAAGDAGQESSEQSGSGKHVLSDRPVRLIDAVLDPGPGVSERARGALGRLAADLTSLTTYRGGLVDHVWRIVARIGLDAEIYASQAASASQVRRFLAYVADFAATRPDTPLSGLVAYLDAAEEFSFGLSRANPVADDAVVVTSVHRAKGLEWDTVYLPGVVNRVFPDSRVTDNPLTSAAALPTAVRSDAAAVPQIGAMTNRGLTAYGDELKDALGLSEDRLAYVAITRAKHRLVVTGHRWGAEVAKPRGRSRYLQQVADMARAVGEVSLLDSGFGIRGEVRAAVETWPERDDPKWRRSAEAVVRARADGLSAPGAAETDLARLEPAVADQIAAWDDTIAWLTQQASPPDLVDVPLPSPLSTSDLARIGDDGGSRLAARLVRPLPHAPSHRAELGSQFHAWVERYFSLSPIPQIVVEPSVDKDLAKLCDQFMDSQFSTARPAVVEQDFITTIAGHAISGRIDAVFRADENPGLVPEGADVLIVDWKTSRGGANPRQLAVYVQAWSAQTGLAPDRVAAGFFYIPTQHLELLDLGQDQAAGEVLSQLAVKQVDTQA